MVQNKEYVHSRRRIVRLACAEAIALIVIAAAWVALSAPEPLTGQIAYYSSVNTRFALCENETLFASRRGKRLLRIEFGDRKKVTEIWRSNDTIRSIARVDDGLAVGTKNGRIRLLANDGETKMSITADTGDIFGIIYSKRHSFLISASFDGRSDFDTQGSLKVWSSPAGTLEKVVNLSRTPLYLALGKDESRVFVGLLSGNEVRSYSLPDLQLIESTGYRYDTLRDIATSPDGTKIAIVFERSVAVHDAATLREIARHTISDSDSIDREVGLCVEWVPGEVPLVLVGTYGKDRTLFAWNPADGSATTILRNSSVRAMSRSPDGRHLAVHHGGHLHVVATSKFMDSIKSPR